MFRVICVKKCWKYKNGSDTAPSPEVGDIDEVISTVRSNGKVYYKFERFEEFAYLSTHFATLPDEPAEIIEEQELVEATA